MVGLLLVSGVAAAGPTARFGLTYGLEDQAAPGAVEVGPLVALGERLGRFVGEIDWSYLSFFDPSASPAGVHRLGLNLRYDLFTSSRLGRCARLWCTQGRSLYVEVGGAERFGQWVVDAYTVTPTKSPQPEVHAGVGFEFDNQLAPNRNGWQVGLRFADSPTVVETPFVPTVCRTTTGTGCSAGSGSPSSRSWAPSVFLEWMFLIGR